MGIKDIWQKYLYKQPDLLSLQTRTGPYIEIAPLKREHVVASGLDRVPQQPRELTNTYNREYNSRDTAKRLEKEKRDVRSFYQILLSAFGGSVEEKSVYKDMRNFQKFQTLARSFRPQGNNGTYEVLKNEKGSYGVGLNAGRIQFLDAGGEFSFKAAEQMLQFLTYNKDMMEQGITIHGGTEEEKLKLLHTLHAMKIPLVPRNNNEIIKSVSEKTNDKITVAARKHIDPNYIHAEVDLNAGNVGRVLFIGDPPKANKKDTSAPHVVVRPN